MRARARAGAEGISVIARVYVCKRVAARWRGLAARGSCVPRSNNLGGRSCAFGRRMFREPKCAWQSCGRVRRSGAAYLRCGGSAAGAAADARVRTVRDVCVPIYSNLRKRAATCGTTSASKPEPCAGARKLRIASAAYAHASERECGCKASEACVEL